MGRAPGPRGVRFIALPAVLALVTVIVTSCSSTAPRTGTAGRKPTYTAGLVSVRMTFPSTPRLQHDPAGLTGNFPAGTSVTAWTIGTLGQLPRPHSFELAIADAPASTNGAAMRAIVTAFTGSVNTTLFGHPAAREINSLNSAAGVDYAGVVAVIVGHELVLAACYDKSKTVVTGFIGSLELLTPPPG